MLNSRQNGRNSLQSPPKILSSTWSILTSLSPQVLVQKITLTITTNTPFLYTSAIFHLPIFVYSHPYNLHQKHFPYLSHLANAGCVKRQLSKEVMWVPTLIPYRSDSENWCIAGGSLWWTCLRPEWKTIQSTFFDILNLLSFLP